MALTARQVAFLVASGIFSRRSGGGGGSKGEKRFTYNKGRAKAVAALKKKGAKGKVGKTYTKTPKNGRFAIGDRAAHLRSGSGTNKRASSDSRAARIAQARKPLERGILPGGYREHRDTVARALRTRRSLDAQSRRDAARYERNGDTQSAARERGRLAESREYAAKLIQRTKQETPRLTRDQARAISKVTKRELQAARKLESQRERATKTLKAIQAAQRLTYNGFTGNQKKRYATLKNRERKLRAKYGL